MGAIALTQVGFWLGRPQKSDEAGKKGNKGASRPGEGDEQARRRCGILSHIFALNKKESHANIFSSKYSRDAKGSRPLVARPEPGTGQCARRNGVRHADGGWMWNNADVQLPLGVVGPSGTDLATEISRDVLRKRSQSRGQTGPLQTPRARRGGPV